MSKGFNLGQISKNAETNESKQGSILGQPSIRQSLSIPNPSQGDTTQTAKFERILRVNLDEIEPYANNPRKRKTGEERAAIKESIRAIGIYQPFHVTKKPGNDKYSIFAGGNSRYELSKELFEETGDIKFASVPVIFENYDPNKHSEVNVLKAHIIENEMRSDVVFWDKANSYENLADLMEIREKSTREIAKIFTEGGTSVHYETLNRLFFATSHLKSLGNLCYALSGPKTLECRKLYYDLQKLVPQQESEFDKVWADALSSFSRLAQESGEVNQNEVEPTLDMISLTKHVKKQVFDYWPELRNTLVQPKQNKNTQAPTNIHTAGANTILRQQGPDNTNGASNLSSELVPPYSSTNQTNQSTALLQQQVSDKSLHDHIRGILSHVGLLETFQPCELQFGYYLELPYVSGDFDVEKNLFPIDKIHPEARDVWWFFVRLSGQLDFTQSGYESISLDSSFLQAFTDLGIWQELTANDIGDPTPSVVQYWFMSCEDETFISLLTDFFKFIRDIKKGDFNE